MVWTPWLWGVGNREDMNSTRTAFYFANIQLNFGVKSLRHDWKGFLSEFCLSHELSEAWGPLNVGV